MRLAIHAPNLGLSLPDQPFGKDVANRGLYTALQAMAALSRSASARRSRRRWLSAAAVWSRTWGGPPQRFVALANGCSCPGGTLLRGQPYLSELAWERVSSSWPSGLQLGGDDPYPCSTQGARTDR